MTAPRLTYQQGDHVCTLYSSPEEQLVAATEYLRGGLQRGERCLYVCCEHDVPSFRAALRAAGIDVDAEERRGALLLLRKEDGHLSGGSFDPDRMIHMLEVAVHEALAAGFSGLCAAGDMVWVLDEAPGTERLAEYEARLNEFYRSHRALGLCLYHRHKLPPETLDHSLATHAYVRVANGILLENPFYESPHQAERRTADARELPRKLRVLDDVRPKAS